MFIIDYVFKRGITFLDYYW